MSFLLVIKIKIETKTKKIREKYAESVDVIK